MFHPLSRRMIARLLVASTLTVGLAACGGGSSDGDNATGSANGDLYAAFDLINQGMTYEQVRDIIGSEYNAGKDDYQGKEVHYKWETGRGGANYVLLSVNFTNGKTTAKIIGGYKGSNSKFW